MALLVAGTARADLPTARGDEEGERQASGDEQGVPGIEAEADRASTPTADAPAPSWFDPYTLEFIAIPLYTQNPDAGPTGLGAASLYLHDGKTHPYKLWLSTIASVSWAGVFSTLSYLEVVRPWDVPLRFVFSAGYQSTLAAHYCGVGNRVTCSVAEAEREAADATTSPAAYDDFVRRYYRFRYHGPVGSGQVRWAVKDMPHKVEAVVGVRAAYYFPGSLGFSGLNPAPYPGSKYAQQFPTGEDGALNIVEAGLMFDNRDQESGPSRGDWVEGSVRTASALTLSRWSFGGGNLIAPGYLPLSREPGRMVLAQRAIFDAIVGDAPTYEQQRVGAPGRSPRSAVRTSGAVCGRAACSAR